ncbi:uncharacterized protein C8A04DRAFT_12805 [Dichotomopilus funicola]|uniref:UBC core domain-containing protein n=1 Tax=Dichotomopilus funicola TaxID=1934379 RepID=A0AAN6V171_9PEZI|nr:hypothetical protein C8A04DRAFT_12805 [Dichotomopilus funicola]
MGKKKFLADISAASQKVASGAIAGVRSITKGESDDEIVIQYHHDGLPQDVHIRVSADDPGEYPDGNMFNASTVDPDAPKPVITGIKATEGFLFGKSVYEVVMDLAGRLNEEVGDVTVDDDFVEGNSDEDDDDVFSERDSKQRAPRPTKQLVNKSAASRGELLQRIRRDLRAVKEAGYKVGFLDGFGKDSTKGIVSISIRMDKLCLSDATVEAWDIQPTDYAVLLIRFPTSYTPLDQVLEQHAALTEVEFRIGKCKRYKPSPGQALRAFLGVKQRPDDVDTGLAPEDAADSGPEFEKLIVSASLDSFMCESFVNLLKTRHNSKVSWETANEIVLERFEGVLEADSRLNLGKDKNQSDDEAQDPACATASPYADAMRPGSDPAQGSLPLIAMQFAMQYFVKCTDYCLRCHRRTEEDFGALRPYVCSSPLCLFQYMTMGFGPSIEHEILTEPYVVDLLVSLCYAAAQPGKHMYRASASLTGQDIKLSLRTLPVGLHFKVPDLANHAVVPLTARLSQDQGMIVFEPGCEQNLKQLAASKSAWVAFRKAGTGWTSHAVVRQVNLDVRSVTVQVMAETSSHWSIGSWVRDQSTIYDQSLDVVDDNVQVLVYDVDFDSLEEGMKGMAIRHVLDTLPPILTLAQWLTDHPHHTLRSLENISPAALSLLRWIVSSNRSCILQVDRGLELASAKAERSAWSPPGSAAAFPEKKDQTTKPGQEVGGTLKMAGRGRNREHERVQGMEGWAQFRFAQGSPDKEQRFNRELQAVAARKGTQENPTIFAWHGSSLSNWHSIVRTGLDYQDTVNGRSFGNGVYFSSAYETSLGYCSGVGLPWPNSNLDITTCLGLNEIINAPEEFECSSPHYVVAQPDWHQCRYLFVQTTAGWLASNKSAMIGKTTLRSKSAAATAGQTQAPVTETGTEYYPQASGRGIFGPSRTPLQIPLSSIPLRTVGPTAALTATMPSKLPKRSVDDLESSDIEYEEDVSRLRPDQERDDELASPPSKKVSRASTSDPMDVEVAGQEYGYVAIDDHNGRKTANNKPTPSVIGNGPPTPSSIAPNRGLTDFEPGTLNLSTITRLPPPAFANEAAAMALSRELRTLQKLQLKTPLHELGWYIDFDEITNLFQWLVQLHSFDPTLPLAQDMRAAGVTSVVLEIRFGPDFPISPPFVRVVRPRFLPFMNGGGGHVTAGGAMCMELLTATGWSAVNTMESVLLQVRMAMCALEPRPARLLGRFADRNGTGGAVSAFASRIPTRDYGVGEAIEAFERAAATHGWTVPEGFRRVANGY